MVIGFQFPDADSELGQVFFNHIFLQVEDQSNSLKMGQSRVRNSLIEFPTLRDDDALHFTDALNPFSSGENSEDSQYGNVLEVSKVFGQLYWLNLHGEHFTETPEPLTISEMDFILNAVGLSFEYRVPETQRWNRGIVDQIGIGFLSFLTDRPGYDNEIDKALKNISLSTILNIYPDPVHFLDVRHQTIYNLGFDEIERVNDYVGLTRANSFATFTSLRYLYRRLERPTAQLSASFGYKVFPNLSDSTNQLHFVANGFYRIGENFDVGLQFQYQHSSGDLEKLFLENESKMKTFVMFLATIVVVTAFLSVAANPEAKPEKVSHLETSHLMQVMMNPGMMDRMLTPKILLFLTDELRLEQEQLQSIQQIELELQKESIRKNADRSIVLVELKALLHQDKIDLEQARQKIQQIATLEGELSLSQIRAFITAREVLTDQQRQLLFTWMSQSKRQGLLTEMYQQRPYTTNGERIYYTAMNDSGQKITFSDGPKWLYAMGGSCVNCHSVDGKGGRPIMMSSMVAPDITYQSLTGGDHAHHGHEHEASATYTNELIKRVITDGISASGYPLSKVMPRWKMSEKDLNNLLEYLHRLDAH
jgi:mono/diheme cytochrome c family protein/Spy/CpxP family protein refolding chaperone